MVLAIIILLILLIGSQISNHKKSQIIESLEINNVQYQKRISELVIEKEETQSGLSLSKIK